MAPAPARTMKSFLTIWIGQVVSILGSGLTAFALAVWLVERTGQATPWALVTLFTGLPHIVLAPLAGSLADRWDRRRLMILADTGDALVTLAVVALLATGELQVWHVYVTAFCSAVFASFQSPAYMASVSMLVPKEQLGRANGLIQMGQSLEVLLAPLLAGVLFGLVGLRGIVTIDLVTYAAAIGALLLVRIPQPEVTQDEQDTPRGRVWRDFVFGWRYLRDRPGLFGLLLYFALVNFLLHVSGVLTGPMVLAFGDAATLGAVQSFSGMGMLAGSVVMGAWGGPKRRVSAVIGFITLAAVGLLVAGLRPSAPLVGAGLFTLLFCIPLAAGNSSAIFQRKVAPQVQGRVFATRGMIARCTMPLASLAVGPLADRWFEPWMNQGGILASTALGRFLGAGPGRGMALMFIVSGVGLLLAGAVVYSYPPIRRLEDELPDAVMEGEPL